MKINRGREEGAQSARASETFTGLVLADPVMTDDEGLGVRGLMVSHVMFTPGARTYWHSHPDGQLLYVTSGYGRVASKDGTTGRISSGDVVWFPPGEEHWHGADNGSFMVHLAVAVNGADWGREVTDEEYDSVE
jgi:quercetin dioxygenase-like cupin family protein